MLHEIQHAVQDLEEYFAGALLSPAKDPVENRALYYGSPHEREALNVEARALGSKKIWYKEHLMWDGYPKWVKEESKLNSKWKTELSKWLRLPRQREYFTYAREIHDSRAGGRRGAFGATIRGGVAGGA
jgi:hypothetical protein